MKRILTFALISLFSVTTFAGFKEARAALNAENYKLAYKEYSALAENGDSGAMIILGRLLDQGEGLSRDYTKAMDWYVKAFAKQNGDAFNYIGVLYRDGLGVPQNREIAYALFWISYWEGLGSEAAQIRNARNLEKTAQQLTKPQIEETLKMTREYIVAYVENRGKLTPQQEQLKYATTGHPIKALADKASSKKNRGAHNLQVELRIPKSTQLDATRAVEFVTDEGVNSNPIKSLKQRDENNYLIISASFVSFGESHHAVMVRTTADAPTQVFLLPATTKASNWSPWTKPDYIETSDAAWTFMQNYNHAERSTTLPSNCFEISYKVE